MDNLVIMNTHTVSKLTVYMAFSRPSMNLCRGRPSLYRPCARVAVASRERRSATPQVEQPPRVSNFHARARALLALCWLLVAVVVVGVLVVVLVVVAVSTFGEALREGGDMRQPST